MALALQQARLAEAAGEIPVGAVVVKDDQLLAAAFNQPIGRHDPSAHAEMLALRLAGQRLGNYRLTGCQLYVTLEPCPMCAGLLVHSRIERLIYGASDSKTGAAGSLMDLVRHPLLNHRMTVTAGVLATPCGQLLSDFFRRRRQQKKRNRQTGSAIEGHSGKMK